MRLIRDVSAVGPARAAGRVVAIGNFDGVHRGHRKILAATVERARADGMEATAMTFEPHPAAVLRPDVPMGRLTTFEDRLEQFAALGIDLTLCLTFDGALAAQDPDTFVRNVLAPLQTRALYVGANYRFGRDRSGDSDTLMTLGARHGFSVHPQEFFTVDGERVSSSRIRTALRAGDVEQAAALLVRPYALKGRVVPGDARGRELGFPTANLEIPEELVPADGVYAARVQVLEAPGDDGEPGVPATGQVAQAAVVHVGARPTFAGGEERRIEVHLLDGAGDLYGHRIRVAFVARVRDPQRFADPAALVEQIGRDIARTRQLLDAAPDAEASP